MSVIEPGAARANLVDRVKNILLSPGPTWDAIDTEPATPRGLYTGYVMPLAAIPAVCQAIGLIVFGVGGFGFSFHFNPIWVIAQAIVSYALSLALVFVLALIIENLAPNFGATKDRIQALKVAAYAPTASWVAGVFMLLPALSVLGVVGGLYSLYLLWVGLPKLMKPPEERATSYYVVVLVVAVVVSLLIGMLTATVGRFGAAGALAGAGHVASAKVTLPGVGSVDTAKLEAASRQMETAANQAKNGKGVQATDPEVLKGYLPVSFAGYARSEVSASSGGVGGVNGSTAEGQYAKGDSHLRLTVTDMGSMGALAGMAGAFNVHQTKETATGYEKVGKVDGRMTTESYDRESKHGEYGVMVGDRFLVQAEGDGATIDELKSAVGAIPTARLEGLAKAG